MKVSLFDFDLPDELIAQTPIEPRDASRMLVVNDLLEDSKVSNLGGYLRAGDLLVFNNTKVVPARLFGRRGYINMEILLHRQDAQGSWLAFARPGKKLVIGDAIVFGEDFFAAVLEKLADGQIRLQFNVSARDIPIKLERYGVTPLPPYIRRSQQGEPNDATRYQTVFAKHAGAVAAPTAGLHFTPTLLERLKEQGIKIAFVTLHVGAGTFQPVKADDISQHVMHHEFAEVSAETATEVNQTRAQGGRIIAVGTTTLRTLESAAGADGALQPFSGDTDIFITPGYRFKIADMLLTNFHLPRSTLFMLVSAFNGLDAMQKAYRHAIEQAYRFYSYGDACLLYRKDL